MIEFDYKLDYKKLDFTDKEVRKLYRIGRGEQGVLLVRYIQMTFVNIGDLKQNCKKVSTKIYEMYVIIGQKMILLVWICVENF